jgi:allantoinase
LKELQMQIKNHDRYDYSPIDERPQFQWPNGKRLAFYVALNVENFSFGEGLGHTPTALGPPPDPRNFGWRDYGLRVGIWRIFDMMDELGLPMCHLLNASVCETMPQIAARIRARGDEVIGHGYTNSERQSEMDEPTEAAMIRNATTTLARHCGHRPFGWMGPWIAETAVTPDLLKESGYSFIMDWPAMLSRHQPATDFHQMIIDQFEEMLRLSEKQSLVFGISLHTFVAGQPFRLRQIRKAIDYIRGHPRYADVWVTTPGEIARYSAALPGGVVS